MRKPRLLAASLLTLSLSCAPDPTGDAIDELSRLAMVYVPIQATSLLSLRSAVEEKGYGQATVDDLQREFVYTETSFGRALVAYSTEGTIPESALFEPMSVTQWLRSALEDESASGVMLDPQSALPLTLSRNEVNRALAELPFQADAPVQLRR